jgi:hypothetical protein
MYSITRRVIAFIHNPQVVNLNFNYYYHTNKSTTVTTNCVIDWSITML